MLIIVPEMLQSKYITDLLEWIEAKGKKLKIVVDESHVTQEISRPSYGLLSNYSEATFLMLSATCSPDELDLMRVKFGIEDKPIFPYISPNVLPANIQYNVGNISKADMIQSICEFIERNIVNRDQIKAIIYANTKKECERLLPLLKTAFINEKIVIYHGGLDEETRRDSSGKFAGNEADIIVSKSF
jgi:superfamily II DNA helicase RecQ